MCGRFTQRLSWAELHELMDLIGAPLNLQPRYNVAPGQEVAIVRGGLPAIRGRGTRQPWLFGLRDGSPFAFAGLWERWAAPEDPAPAGSLFGPEPAGPVETFTILTTAANATVAAVHGRMPVILPPDVWGPWLAGEDIPLGPYPADEMHAHPVSTLVNKPANDDPRCVEPVSLC